MCYGWKWYHWKGKFVGSSEMSIFRFWGGANPLKTEVKVNDLKTCWTPTCKSRKRCILYWIESRSALARVMNLIFGTVWGNTWSSMTAFHPQVYMNVGDLELTLNVCIHFRTLESPIIPLLQTVIFCVRAHTDKMKSNLTSLQSAMSGVYTYMVYLDWRHIRCHGNVIFVGAS